MRKKKSQDFTKEFLTFTRSERIGILILIFIICVMLLFILFMDNFKKVWVYDNRKADFLIAQLDSAKNQLENEEEVPELLFAFNPNFLSLDSLMLLGFSEKQAAVIIKYRSKGGKYYKKEDFKKMYTVSEAMYEKLEAYIDIPKEESNFDPKKQFVQNKNLEKSYETIQKAESKKSAEPIIVEVNSADTTELKRVRGIGSYFAKKIVEQRTRLGGFYSLNQINEIYAFRDKQDIVENLKPFLSVDTEQLRKINLNEASEEELSKHPYIKYSWAKVWVAFRNEHGPYNSVQDLLSNGLVNDELYPNIAPYLSIE